MKLEDLVKFLSDSGVTVPEGADKAAILKIIDALLGGGDGGDGGEGGDGGDKTPAPAPVGLS